MSIKINKFNFKNINLYKTFNLKKNNKKNCLFTYKSNIYMCFSKKQYICLIQKIKNYKVYIIYKNIKLKITQTYIFKFLYLNLKYNLSKNKTISIF